MQRSVYNKCSEIEIDVDENDFQHYLKYNAPKGATAQDYMSDYLIDNEHLFVDKIDINEIYFRQPHPDQVITKIIPTDTEGTYSN